MLQYPSGSMARSSLTHLMCCDHRYVGLSLQVKELLKQINTLGSTSERYRIASLFLGFIFLLSIGVIANRQLELNSTIDRSRNCTGKVVDLVKDVGKCGKEQLDELKTCREKVNNLTELKGRYDESQRWHNSTALIKQAEDLMRRLMDIGDLAAKEAEGKDNCNKNLNKVQAEVRQLAVNMTKYVIESNSKYDKCYHHLTTSQNSLTTCEKNLEACNEKKGGRR